MTKPSQGKPAYAICESVHASARTPWHVRKLDDAGLRLGGGITTGSICGRLQPMGVPFPPPRPPTEKTFSGTPRTGTGGWDLDVEITEHHLEKSCCKECVAGYRDEVKVSLSLNAVIQLYDMLIDLEVVNVPNQLARECGSCCANYPYVKLGHPMAEWHKSDCQWKRCVEELRKVLPKEHW